MEKVTNPTVKQLAQGKKFNAKQMSAKAGDLLPKHTASIESVLIIMEGECILSIDGTDHTLKQGDSFIVPSAIKHQIKLSPCLDRKSTRLNSSHVAMSYAVFCLKKKKT